MIIDIGGPKPLWAVSILGKPRLCEKGELAMERKLINNALKVVSAFRFLIEFLPFNSLNDGLRHED